MSAVEPLADSYLDLWRHFDPAAASEAGPGEADARLGDFTAESVRRHAAAFRSLASALEALAVERLGDEIDRTVLLDRIRAILDRLEHDRPHLRDPGFWLDHLIRALAALLARPREETGARAYAAARRIEGIPGFLDQARATLRRPPAILVDYALTLLGPLGELLVRAAAEFGREAPGGPEALNPRVAAALEALTRFGGALREMESDPNQGAPIRGRLGSGGSSGCCTSGTRCGPGWPSSRVMPRGCRRRSRRSSRGAPGPSPRGVPGATSQPKSRARRPATLWATPGARSSGPGGSWRSEPRCRSRAIRWRWWRRRATSASWCPKRDSARSRSGPGPPASSSPRGR